MANVIYTPEKIWYITTPDGDALDILIRYLDLERVFDHLVMGFGNDSSDASSIIADSKTIFAHFYHVRRQSVWIKYTSEAVQVVEGYGFSATIEAHSIQG